MKIVFVPFPGDFFSMCIIQMLTICRLVIVFVPFPGDFFSIIVARYGSMIDHACFRPLSRGLFFNNFILYCDV